MNRKLRIGILADSGDVPAWAYRMLERIVHSDWAEVGLVVVNGASSAEAPRSFLGKLRASWSRLGIILYMRVERLLHSPRPDARQPMALTGLLPSVPVITVVPRQTRFSDYLPDEAVQAIRDADLDVMIRLGFRILRGDVLQAARFGIWSFHHGDNRVNRGGPPGFWEVVEKWPVTGSMVQILSENLDGGLVLDRASQMTDQASVRRNLNDLLWNSLAMLPRALEQLHTMGGDAFMARARAANAAPAFYSERLYVPPGNARALWILLLQAWRWTTRKIAARLTRDQWMLLYRKRADGEMSMSFRQFEKMVPPRDRFWADPHVIHRDGVHHIFLEEFLYQTRRGRIAVITVAPDGSWQGPTTVLERPYHLSYPFVFEHEGSTYMIPESVENRTVELYEAVEFPGTWRKVRDLMSDVAAVDATLLQQGGRWWMFVNMAAEPEGSLLNELFLFSAETPVTSKWTPHPLNPIVSGVQGSRPAGRIFERDGLLYRPGQNSAGRYGYGMILHQILRLDEEGYDERPVASIDPNWDARIGATHSLSFDAGLTVIDGEARVSRW